MNARYQPGGDIYAKLEAKYGTAGADRVAAADASGELGAVNEALTELKYGAPLNDSTTSIFFDQVTTDPLGAPLESANNQLANVVKDIVKNPYVLAALALYLFLQLGGFNWLRRQLT